MEEDILRDIHAVKATTVHTGKAAAERGAEVAKVMEASIAAVVAKAMEVARIDVRLQMPMQIWIGDDPANTRDRMATPITMMTKYMARKQTGTVQIGRAQIGKAQIGKDGKAIKPNRLEATLLTRQRHT
mmetsp:Transcript_42212/g.99075  ORF Transcript_42212/g.99075 Transcript_42212/m.99075 type:complete len:129 (-) Transcript_42212:3084-3470(-)